MGADRHRMRRRHRPRRGPRRRQDRGSHGSVPHVTCTFTNQALAEAEPADPADPARAAAPPGDIGAADSRARARPRRPTPSAGRTLPAGAVQTGFGRGTGVPAVFRAGSPEHRLLQAAGDATTRDPRVARGHRSRVDAMIVRVPRLGIRGRLQRLDVAAGHRLRVPADPRRVGWWSGGALPGPPGSTVLAGHVDGPAGPAVFNRLSHARKGDLITISLRAGRPLRYRVTAVREYTKGRMPRQLVFGASSRQPAPARHVRRPLQRCDRQLRRQHRGVRAADLTGRRRCRPSHSPSGVTASPRELPAVRRRSPSTTASTSTSSAGRSSAATGSPTWRGRHGSDGSAARSRSRSATPSRTSRGPPPSPTNARSRSA